jgi:hypothetical protein
MTKTSPLMMYRKREFLYMAFWDVTLGRYVNGSRRFDKKNSASNLKFQFRIYHSVHCEVNYTLCQYQMLHY